jgi:hypothetical protein
LQEEKDGESFHADDKFIKNPEINQNETPTCNQKTVNSEFSGELPQLR